MVRLLERGDELGLLAEAVDGAIAGRGCLVLVAGEPGIGKTSLVRAVRASLPDAVAFASGACEPLSVPVPLAPLRELLHASGAEDLAAPGSGTVVLAPAGAPHTFRVESDTARMLFLSTPAGIEDYVRALAEPARWPWLQPPPDRPRVSAGRIAAVERELGVIRHGPPPPSR